MTDEINVHIIDRGRRNLYLRYIDPLSGKPVEKSAGTSKYNEAVKAAGKWQAELREGRYQKPNRTTWEAFREHYSANALPGLATRTQQSYETALNVFEQACSPQYMADVTTFFVTAFATRLRTQGKAEATIACYLRHVKAAMRWANRQGLLNVLPLFTMPKRIRGAKVMRGRPITGEEFDRMIEATPKVVENVAADSWTFYLNGLWASGLRLSESLTLRWDDAPDSIVVDLGGRRPMLRISAETEKGNQDRLLPITPEFARLLASVPDRDRRGRVFRLLGIDGTPLQGERCVVSKIVSAIGEAAGVVVDEKQVYGKTVRKFASAHDLRRAFGQRWSGRIMPNVLRELMRHADIGTTMKFYVGQNAEAMSDALWAAEGDTFGDTRQSIKAADAKNTLKKAEGKGFSPSTGL